MATEWESMGRYVNNFTVERHADGRLELFAIGEDYNICHIWQTTKNGTWSNWDVKLHTTGFISVGAGKSQDGRIYVIALSEDNSVLNIHENFIGGEWSPWSLLDFSYWMSEIYDDIKDRLVSDIVYPGSHDAGSYNFYTTPQHKPEQDIHHISPEGKLLISKELVEKVRCVQMQSIAEQLRGGCRYFDLRIVRARNGVFYCQHEYVAESMSNMLSEIKVYLEEGERRKKRELLFLDISVFCNNLVSTDEPAYTPKDIIDFRRLVEDAIGKYMYFIPDTHGKAPTNVQKQTYGSFFTEDRPSVIVSGIVYKDVGMGTFRGKVWPNSSDVKYIIDFEKKNYNYYVATATSNPADYYMTHFTSTIHLKDFFSNNQLDLVKKINEQMWQLEDILFLSTTNGCLINILYLDSPAYSPAAHYAYIMNNMITRQKRLAD